MSTHPQEALHLQDEGIQGWGKFQSVKEDTSSDTWEVLKAEQSSGPDVPSSVTGAFKTILGDFHVYKRSRLAYFHRN